MMPKLDLWVLGRLLRHLTAMREVQAPIAFHVSLSNLTLGDPESLKLIETAIRSSGVQARQLVLEITETTELTSLHAARKFISALKKLGCRFALDDFGTLGALRATGADYAQGNYLGEPRPLRSVDFGALLPTR